MNINSSSNQDEKKLNKRKALLAEKKYLEKELVIADTVIRCQSRKNEIYERLEEIDDELVSVSVDIVKGNNSTIERERERERESKNNKK